MQKIHYKLKQFMEDYFIPKNPSIGVTALIAGFFTMFALLFLGAEWLYGSLPDYSEFIAGLTTLSAYPKQADMQLFFYSLFGILILYFVFVLLFNLWKKYMHIDKRIGICYLVVYFGILLCVFAQKKSGADLASLLVAAVLLAIVLFWNYSSKLTTYVNFIMILFFLEYSFYALYGTVSNFIGSVSGSATVFYVGRTVVFLAVLAVTVLFRIRKEQFPLEKLLYASQLLLPLGLFGFFYFDYVYEATGETVRLYDSGRFRFALLLVIAGMIGYEVYCGLKKRKNVMLTSLLAIGMMKVYTIPKAVLNIDYFHNGEITVPMQQLISYGKLPYKDLVPIHGFCDYFYGVVNYLFFDGSYLSLNAASVVGNLIMISMLAVTVYFFFEKKEQAGLIIYLFSGFMIHTAGMRYLFLFIMFFVLFSERARKGFLNYLWWWVFLSILAIGWNPSIGGSGAIAFLPIVLCRLYKESFGEFGELIKGGPVQGRKWAVGMWLRYGFLLVLGLCFIPLFLQIVVYLKENTGSTLVANGMGLVSNLTKLSDYLVPGFETGAGQFFLKTFFMFIPFLCCLFCGFYGQSKEHKKKAMEYAVCLFICFYVIANYAFVRYDNGLRTGVVGVFFSILILFHLLESRRQDYSRNSMEMAVAFSLLVLCVYQADTGIFMEKDELGQKGYVNETETVTIMGETVEDPIVYVTGESVNITGLGNGFVSGNSLNSLKNIGAVLDACAGEDGSYVDLTNAVADYVIFDKASALSYTSGYNISNELMQDKAIKTLEEENPGLILVAPYIKFDDVTISLRCGKLYDYIMKAGYQPYVYENVIYLLKDREPLEGSSDGTVQFADLMHKESLQFLPAVWGNAGLEEKLVKSSVSYEEKAGEENSISVTFDQPISGEKISYVEIKIPGEDTALLERLREYDSLAKGSETDGEVKQNDVDPADLDHLTITFQSRLSGQEMTYHFTAYLYGDTYLIPVKTSPYWSQEKGLEGFEVTLQNREKTVASSMEITLYE